MGNHRQDFRDHLGFQTGRGIDVAIDFLWIAAAIAAAMQPSGRGQDHKILLIIAAVVLLAGFYSTAAASAVKSKEPDRVYTISFVCRPSAVAFDDPLIAAVDVAHVADLRIAVGDEPGDDERGAAAQVDRRTPQRLDAVDDGYAILPRICAPMRRSSSTCRKRDSNIFSITIDVPGQP